MTFKTRGLSYHYPIRQSIIATILIPLSLQIQHQLSKCTCTKKFLVTRVAEGQYRVSNVDWKIQHYKVFLCSHTSNTFLLGIIIACLPLQFGDNQKLRLVRILRSTVMVRVGGGWEPLEEFLMKHDPCRGDYYIL